MMHNRVLEALGQRYRALLERSVGRRGWLLACAALALCVLAVLGGSIGRDFLPYIDEGSLWLQVQMPPGITLDKAARMANALRTATLEFPEVSYVVTQTGRNDDGTDYWTPSHIEASIGLRPYKDWPSGMDKQGLIAALGARYAQMPGYTVSMMQPMIDGVQDKLSGAHSDLTVKVFGDDLQQVRGVAEQVATALHAVPGAADIAVDVEPPLPNLQVRFDRDAAARYGINAADVSDLIATGIGGSPIGRCISARRATTSPCVFRSGIATIRGPLARYVCAPLPVRRYRYRRSPASRPPAARA